MSITEKISRDRVCGFLKSQGKTMVNGNGEEILLTGMGLGNWLVPEGYMWRFGGTYNSPRRIEGLVRDLCGSRYTEGFWKTFRENYITEEDVRAMAEAGFNSVRLPINWRILLEDEPGITWKEEGFALIDRFLDWCEKWSLYVVLDLHCAPGGQTGSNIDDSIDDHPRLFTDTRSDSREKAMELWCEMARRYKDRWIVGMYDFLNEPCSNGMKFHGELDRALADFYHDLIERIRQIDNRHMLSLECPQWSSRPDIFDEFYDDNINIHFHRYWLPPTQDAYTRYLEVQNTANCPLYLGETGENHPDWFAAMYALSLENNIGYNIWPWKKLETGNSPCSVKKPAGWDGIIAYTNGGDRPSYEEAQAAFDEYLTNCLYENCEYRPSVVPSIFRSPGCRLPACAWKTQSGVKILQGSHAEGDDASDDWLKYKAQLTEGSAAVYTFYGTETPGTLVLESQFDNVSLTVTENGETIYEGTLHGQHTLRIPKRHTGDTAVEIRCTSGSFSFSRILYDRD